jgi:hypothetical protein
VGAEYDSNVSIEEVDRASNEGDYGLTLEAKVGAEQQLTERLELALHYDFSQTFYSEFSEVDRQTHILGSDLGWRLNEVDANLSAFYINSRLDGKDFLQLARISPALSGFVARQWFLRGGYIFQDKSLQGRSLRDADSHAGEFDLYFFAQGLRRYFNLGYRYRYENARAAPLDYASNAVKLRYIQRVELASRLAKLELFWRYENRDYRAITPEIGEKRRDDRHRLGIDFEIPLFADASLQLYYVYADYQSNLERVDYTQNVGGVKFVYRW